MTSEIAILRRLDALEQELETLRKADSSAIRLPYTQRVLNAFPLASSPGNPGDFAQPTGITILVFRVSVYVVTTNNGTNFWTIALQDTAGSTLASVVTSAASANTWTRLTDTTITQPGSSNVALSVLATATLSPGAIFIVPEVLCALAL